MIFDILRSTQNVFFEPHFHLYIAFYAALDIICVMLFHVLVCLTTFIVNAQALHSARRFASLQNCFEVKMTPPTQWDNIKFYKGDEFGMFHCRASLKDDEKCKNTTTQDLEKLTLNKIKVKKSLQIFRSYETIEYRFTVKINFTGTEEIYCKSGSDVVSSRRVNISSAMIPEIKVTSTRKNIIAGDSVNITCTIASGNIDVNRLHWKITVNQEETKEYTCKKPRCRSHNYNRSQIITLNTIEDNKEKRIEYECYEDVRRVNFTYIRDSITLHIGTRSKLAFIFGSVIGVICLVTFIAFIIFYVRRKRQLQQSVHMSMLRGTFENFLSEKDGCLNQYTVGKSIIFLRIIYSLCYLLFVQ